MRRDDRLPRADREDVRGHERPELRVRRARRTIASARTVSSRVGRVASGVDSGALPGAALGGMNLGPMRTASARRSRPRVGSPTRRRASAAARPSRRRRERRGKTPPACGAKVLPLVEGNTWTYDAGRRAAPPTDAIKRIAPAQPKHDRDHREVGRRPEGRRHRRHARGEDHDRSARKDQKKPHHRRAHVTIDDHAATPRSSTSRRQLLLRRRARRLPRPRARQARAPEGHELAAHQRRHRRRRVARGHRRALDAHADRGLGRQARQRQARARAPVHAAAAREASRRSSAATRPRSSASSPPAASRSIRRSPDAAEAAWSCPADWIIDAVARRRRRRRAGAQQLRAHVPARRREAEVHPPCARAGALDQAAARRASAPATRGSTTARSRRPGGLAAGDVVDARRRRRPARDRVRRSALADPRARARPRSRRRVRRARGPRARAEAAAARRARDPLLVGCTGAPARPRRGRRAARASSSTCYADTAVVVFDGPAAAAFWRARLAAVLAGLERGGAAIAHAWLRGERGDAQPRRGAARRSAGGDRRSPRTRRGSRSTSAPARRPGSSSTSATTAARSAATPRGASVLEPVLRTPAGSRSTPRSAARRASPRSTSRRPRSRRSRSNLELSGLPTTRTSASPPTRSSSSRARRARPPLGPRDRRPAELRAERAREAGRARARTSGSPRAALAVVEPGGRFALASCSSHVTEADLLGVVRSARSCGCARSPGAASDHPVLPAFPEGRYLEVPVLRRGLTQPPRCSTEFAVRNRYLTAFAERLDTHAARCAVRTGRSSRRPGVVVAPTLATACKNAQRRPSAAIEPDEHAKTPTCRSASDGRDNDGDGKIDYPDDPGCFAPNQDDETDDCPDGPNCPQCANGKDDDSNGLDRLSRTGSRLLRGVGQRRVHREPGRVRRATSMIKQLPFDGHESRAR